MLEKINLSFSALLDRLFVGSFKVTQDAISRSSPAEQQGIAESLRTGKPCYYFSFESNDKKNSSKDSDKD